MAVLATEGAGAVKIDRLALQVGLSKGSFFHHFSDVAAFRRELIATWEARAVPGLGDKPAAETIQQLAQGARELIDLPLERAVRAWAVHESEATAALARVDQARLAALERVWGQLVDDPARSRTAALLPHLVLIGASVAQPRPSESELAAVFALLGQLATAVPGNPSG